MKIKNNNLQLSIRKFLLTYLLLTIAIVITMIIASSYLGLNEIYTIALVFPLSSILVWFIINKGLNALDDIAKELANRKQNNLEPLKTKRLPKELKPIINELNTLFKHIKDGYERETRFAADAAHELRTPLAALKVQAQVALNTLDLDEKNIAIKKVIDTVNRNVRIVQQLLTISKLVPEKNNNYDAEKVDLNQITKEILTLIAPQAIEKNVDLELFTKQNIRKFTGNQTTIGILIKNLVENAINYCDQTNGKVIVRTLEQDGEIILEVQDNGQGIPQKQITRVFERFYRGLGNKNSGSGLGLSIVKQIVELHHAKISLQPLTPKNGLLIRIFFPTKALGIRDDKKKWNKPKRQNKSNLI